MREFMSLGIGSLSMRPELYSLHDFSLVRDLTLANFKARLEPEPPGWKRAVRWLIQIQWRDGRDKGPVRR